MRNAVLIVIGIAIGTGAAYLLQRPCPACICPPSVEVKLNEFNPDKVKFKKGNFTYEPHNEIHDVTIVADTAILSLLLQAVQRKESDSTGISKSN